MKTATVSLSLMLLFTGIGNAQLQIPISRAAVASDVATLFCTGGVSGQYLAAKGTCQTATGGGSSAVLLTCSPCGTTPTFTVSAASTPQMFYMTLTSGSVTMSTLNVTSAAAGQQIGFLITQTSAGGYTFAWPSNVKGACAVDPAPNVTTTVIGTWDTSVTPNAVVTPSCITNDTWYGIQSPTSSTTPTPASGQTFLATDPSTGAFKESISGASFYPLPQRIASGTATMGTSAISSGLCASVVTVSATGVATTDVMAWTPSTDISSTTGYAVSTSGGLAIYPYPTSGNVNFHVCNPTANSITPSAITINWTVVR